MHEGWCRRCLPRHCTEPLGNTSSMRCSEFSEGSCVWTKGPEAYLAARTRKAAGLPMSKLVQNMARLIQTSSALSRRALRVGWPLGWHPWMAWPCQVDGPHLDCRSTDEAGSMYIRDVVLSWMTQSAMTYMSAGVCRWWANRRMTKMEPSLTYCWHAASEGLVALIKSGEHPGEHVREEQRPH